MSENDTQHLNLIHLTTSILAGWNIMVMIWSILSGVVAHTLATQLPNMQAHQELIWVLQVIFLVLGAVAGVAAFKKLRPYFSGFETVGSYIWLCIMVYVAFATLPFRMV